MKDYQLKEIDVIYLPYHIERGLPEINIIAVGESVGHIYRVAKTYVDEVKKINSEGSQYAHYVGGRNDDYLMVITRSIALHLVTKDSKEDHDVRAALLDTATYEEDKEAQQAMNEEVQKKKIRRLSKKWVRKVNKATDY